MMMKPAEAQEPSVQPEIDKKVSAENIKYVRIPNDIIPAIHALLVDACRVEAGDAIPPEIVADFFSEAAVRWIHQAASYRKISW